MRIILLVLVFNLVACSAYHRINLLNISAIENCERILRQEGSPLFTESDDVISPEFRVVRTIESSLSDYILIHFGVASEPSDETLIEHLPPIICWVDATKVIVKSLSAPTNAESMSTIKYRTFTEAEMISRKNKLDEGIRKGALDITTENYYVFRDGKWQVRN